MACWICGAEGLEYEDGVDARDRPPTLGPMDYLLKYLQELVLPRPRLAASPEAPPAAFDAAPPAFAAAPDPFAAAPAAEPEPAAAAAPPPPPPQAPTSPGGDPFAALTGLPATGADKHFQATAGRTGPAFVPQQHATPAYAQQQQLRQQQMQAHAQMAYLQQQQQALAMQQRALAGGAPHAGQPGLMMMPGLSLIHI